MTTREEILEILEMSKKQIIAIFERINTSSCNSCNDCSSCSDCSYCIDCKNITTSTQYAICNVQLTKEEYELKIKELQK